MPRTIEKSISRSERSRSASKNNRSRSKSRDTGQKPEDYGIFKERKSILKKDILLDGEKSNQELSKDQSLYINLKEKEILTLPKNIFLDSTNSVPFSLGPKKLLTCEEEYMAQLSKMKLDQNSTGKQVLVTMCETLRGVIDDHLNTEVLSVYLIGSEETLTKEEMNLMTEVAKPEVYALLTDSYIDCLGYEVTTTKINKKKYFVWNNKWLLNSLNSCIETTMDSLSDIVSICAGIRLVRISKNCYFICLYNYNKSELGRLMPMSENKREIADIGLKLIDLSVSAKIILDNEPSISKVVTISTAEERDETKDKRNQKKVDYILSVKSKKKDAINEDIQFNFIRLGRGEIILKVCEPLSREDHKKITKGLAEKGITYCIF